MVQIMGKISSMHKVRAREGVHRLSVCISTDHFGFVYMVEDDQLSYLSARSTIVGYIAGHTGGKHTSDARRFSKTLSI